MNTGLRPLDLAQHHLDDGDVDLRLGVAVRLRAWLAHHARSLLVLAFLLPAVGLLHATNMFRAPGINITDDEGTYVDQAYAVDVWHQLGHYTYWYDHPPLGWIQIAAYARLTGAWDRAPYAVAVGREFMLSVTLVSCALLYVLARRLGARRWTAVLAVVLFTASPLALHYHRMVWLDNIGVLWLLAAMVLAVAPRRSLSSAAGSAACLAVAVLSKETVLLLAPVVLYLLWQHSSRSTRRYRIGVFTALAGALVGFYPLYAAIKNELLPGPGHVSLLWAVDWQLHGRGSNGSLFDAAGGASDYFHSWVHLDPWLLGVGIVLALPALASRRWRPLGLGLLFQAGLALRPGYLPQAYIVAMLPFAALVIAGVAEDAVSAAGRLRSGRFLRPVMAVALVAASLLVAPSWARGDRELLTGGSTVPTAAALAWIREHVPPGKLLVVDDGVWLDLVRAGYSPNSPHLEVVWVYKVGTDPAIQLKPGVRGVDYFVYSMDPITAAKDSPQIVAPYKQSKVVARFGSGDNTITVRKVMHDRAPLPAS